MFEACVVKQQSLIKDFKSRLEELIQARDLETQEMSGASKKNTSKKEYDAVFDTLEFAEEELKLLNYLGKNLNKTHDSPELGAVVETNHGTFFISVSIEEFYVEGKRYYGISTQSPLFKVMRGKHSGDSFTFRDEQYTIHHIF